MTLNRELIEQLILLIPVPEVSNTARNVVRGRTCRPLASDVEIKIRNLKLRRRAHPWDVDYAPKRFPLPEIVPFEL